MSNLNVRQKNFLRALIECGSVSQACEKANIQEHTGQKYLEDHLFLEVYQRLMRKRMREVNNQIQKASQNALNVLTEMMDDPSQLPEIRIESAEIILNFAYHLSENEEQKGCII
ncbi:phage replication protein [Enterococcus mundtii]|uniref:phage replication protein n=1 Tax=Enterococcus mundtii TaxID=53346 RepID=UPI000CF1B9E9|nr:phage replication protein [Enterococcus mundtii]PQC32092.1 phage replication protein [Enterococcus mundtii]